MTDLTFSASGTSLYQECQRKYAFRYICNIDSPTTPSQALGKDVDDNKLQPYLRDGQEIETDSIAGQIANAGVHLLPPPKYPGLQVQKHFLMPAPGARWQWQGYIDLWTPNGGLPDFDSNPNVPVVVDFKTTKNWNWIKHPEDLAVDPQAQLYATWAMWSTGKREVDLVWTYFRTTPPFKARRSHLRVNGQHVAEQFSRLNAIGEKMLVLRQAGKGLNGQAATDFALSLPASPDACDNFGGCPHRHLCNLSPSDFIDGDLIPSNRRLPIVPAQETVDLFASLAAKAVDPVGINPPEKDLPPAPAVGDVEVDADAVITETTEKPKRGRKPKAPSAVVETPPAASEIVFAADPATADPVPAGADFMVAWSELGSAVYRLLKKVG